MLNVRVTGLDRLQRELREAQAGMKALHGAIGRLEFDAGDRHSVDAAIRKMERAVDQKAGRYRSNPLIADLVRGMKASYREQILEQARKARSD